jgi:F-type H+-transporting ATPase subunit delta
LIARFVARRYAKALVDVAAATNELEAVRQELSGFVGLLRERRDLRQFLLNPGILRRDKDEVLDGVVSRLEFRPLTRSFLRILLGARRLPALASVLDAYESLMDERLARVKAIVTAAAPLDAEMQEHLRQRLEQVTGKTVYLKVQHDPGILGGLITQIGSLVYDGSLRGQLARLREEMIHSA